MKIILAFDSFKNCLSSPEICRILKQSMLETDPACEIVSMPLGDGGEGTARAIAGASGGIMHKRTVHGPLFTPVEAEWGALPDGSAVFEMASASGIELISRSERDPMRTTTYGTGELIRYLVCEKKIRRIFIGIGGSATVDGGIGMLQALGVQFYDLDGEPLPVPACGEEIRRLVRIDLTGLPPELRECSICIASDVTNPLCGENGAARVFAPQKGADAATVELLEKNLLNFGSCSVVAGIAGNFDSPGDGAAGGLGFALRAFLGAESRSGADLVLDQLAFDDALKGADLVLTGEGCSDFQTAHGKLCKIVSDRARRAGVPVFLLSGALGERAVELDAFFDGVLALSSKPCLLDEALAATPENLVRMGKAILKLAKLR